MTLNVLNSNPIHFGKNLFHFILFLRTSRQLCPFARKYETDNSEEVRKASYKARFHSGSRDFFCRKDFSRLGLDIKRFEGIRCKSPRPCVYQLIRRLPDVPLQVICLAQLLEWRLTSTVLDFLGRIIFFFVFCLKLLIYLWAEHTHRFGDSKYS